MNNNFLPYQIKKTNDSNEALASQLADIATNAKGQGIVLNDNTKATSNTTILQNLFANSTTPVYLPSGTIYVNGNLPMGKNVQVYGTPQTILSFTNTTGNGITVNDHCVLKNMQIQIPDGFTGAVLFMDGANKINTCTVEDIYVSATTTNPTATGILGSAKPLNTWICDAKFERIYLKNMAYGITLEDDQLNNNGWVNANKFKNIFMWANYGVYINTGGPSGNEFNIQFQTITTTVEGIHCIGGGNIFSGFIWDIAGYGAGKYIFNFLQGSSNNVVQIPFSTAQLPYIIDNGVNNVIVNMQNSNIKPISITGSYHILPDGTGKKDLPVFRGNQDDCLAYLDQKATITVTGSKNWNFPVSTFFRPYYQGSGNYFTDPSVTNVVIEAVMGTTPINNMYFLGLSFTAGQIPDSLTVDIVQTNGGAYSNLATITGNRESTILIPMDPYGQTIYKFKVTITKAVTSATFNPNKQINLERIYGGNIGTYYGSTYLEKGGGILYGGLNFSVGGISRPITRVVSNWALTSNDSTIIGDATSGAITFTLPDATTIKGREYVLKKIDSSANTVTVATTSSQTIDGVTTQVLSTQWSKLKVQSDGANWQTV